MNKEEFSNKYLNLTYGIIVYNEVTLSNFVIMLEHGVYISEIN